jgi:hypothetical protein
MESTNSQVSPAPPSLMKALLAGFDAVSNHIYLVFFSILLDLMLWLGPHFQLARLVQSVFNQAAALPDMNSPDVANMMQTSRDLWTALAERFNLLAVLRSYPVGVPSLMSGRLPIAIPGGKPFVWEVPSFGATAGLWLLLSLLGLLAGTVYFAVVAQAALEGKIDWRGLLAEGPWSLLQVLLLTLFWLGLLILVSIPFSCMLSLFLVTGSGLGQVAILLFGGLLAWFLLPLVFSPHGIFVNRRKVLNSIRDGVRLTRLTLPSTGLFLLIALLLSEGLDILWASPADTSWLTLIGVVGHAFVTCGLLAASFVYYRDADRWVQRVIQQAKFSANQSQITKA